MTDPRCVTIGSASELEAVTNGHWFFFDVQAVVQVPDASREQTVRWQRSLNDAFQDCGCTQGAVLSFLTLGAMVGGYTLYFWHESFPWSSFLFNTLAAVVLAGLLGKVVGLTGARMRIARITHEIRTLEAQRVLRRLYLFQPANADLEKKFP